MPSKYALLRCRVGCVCCAAILALAACNDAWSDHYDATSTTQESGTLWDAIAAQPDLSNFARVVEACGYDILLSGSQAYTVFAPTNDALTTAEAEALIEEFRQQQAAGTRVNDNTVVRQFLQNHIALYKWPVSSITNDSITLMNDKYAVLTPSTLAGQQLLSTNALYSNGLLFTLGHQLDYFPNVFEYLGHDDDLDSVYRFLNSFSVYEFNDAKSVPGEIVDGQTVYLDSVSELRNTVLQRYGLINSEDSTYWMLCPTNSEWRRLVGEYEPFFNYANSVNQRDSLIYANTRLAIISGAFFSRTINSDEALRDSAVSTRAISHSLRRMTGWEDAYYTYFKPYAQGGAFYGTEDITCSNGHVLKSPAWGISKFETFAQTIKVEAENILAQDTIIDAVDPLIVREVASNNPFYGKVSGNSFVEVQPDPATAQVTVQYRVPNILSGMKYDIYAVFAPATAYDTLAVDETKRPNIILPTLQWLDQNGKEGRNNRMRTKTVNTAVMDTIQLVTGQTFPTSSYGLAEEQVKLRIKSNIQSNQTTTHSGTLRIDCIIFRPTELGGFAA